MPDLITSGISLFVFTTPVDLSQIIDGPALQRATLFKSDFLIMIGVDASDQTEQFPATYPPLFYVMMLPLKALQTEMMHLQVQAEVIRSIAIALHLPQP
jgi:hypothetical protein